MAYSILLSVFRDVSLKVKQVVLPSFRLSFRFVQTSSSTVKQVVLLLRIPHPSKVSGIYALFSDVYII